jgi:hypothetical protein
MNAMRVKTINGMVWAWLGLCSMVTACGDDGGGGSAGEGGTGGSGSGSDGGDGADDESGPPEEQPDENGGE